MITGCYFMGALSAPPGPDRKRLGPGLLKGLGDPEGKRIATVKKMCSSCVVPVFLVVMAAKD
jgi:hypothetical protein